MSVHWAIGAAASIKALRIEHRTYCRAVTSIFCALSIAQPGEVVVVVGPSRVGKSSAVEEALTLSVKTPGESRKHHVIVETENAAAGGAFSTKAFMRLVCRGINHPIYGMSGPDDPWGVSLHARLNRTPESMLRDAVEQGLILLGIRYLVADEAHHVGYAGNKALAILDSWKCLAFRTSTVLVLVGSYQLLDILACAPHLLGRQCLIEFPRYKSGDAEDVREFAKVLRTLSPLIRFENSGSNLRSWTRLLFTHSLGCVGNLSKWLRASLGEVAAERAEMLTERALLATRLPSLQESSMAAEILAGEAAMLRDSPTTPDSSVEAAKKGSRKPFQRNTRRFKIGGRS